ncbi:MAG: hypothetical protein ACTTKL_06655 [Treponema sp.]
MTALADCKNRAGGKTMVFAPVIAFTFCLVLLGGCGLDEFFVLDSPVTVYHYSDSNSQYDNRYVEFSTNEGSSQMQSYLSASSSFKFLGTAVYYKIYNDLSTMSSAVSSLGSLSSSKNESAAASSLIDSHGYKQLGLKDETKTPLIEGTGNNRRVYIRLSNYKETSSSDFIAEVTINRKTASESRLGLPRREGNRYTFDFGRTAKGSENAHPQENDSDVKYTSSGSPSKWYVDLYAVAVGQDTSFTVSYSNILHLGSIPIDANDEDN